MSDQSSERPQPMRAFRVDELRVEVYATRAEMGRAAAIDVAARMRELLAGRDHISMIFAAAPSQNELLAELAEQPDIDWRRVHAFHMDEYLGLPGDAPQSFGRFLRERLFDLVHPGAVHYINGAVENTERERARYTALLEADPPDIVCLGIGENGHIAFNDPGVADFGDPLRVRRVTLDERSRQQQVHDGAFPDLASVPRQALTLTIPALTQAAYLYCVVPGPTKTEAVAATLQGPITEQVPATILRRHPNAALYLDRPAAGE